MVRDHVLERHEQRRAAVALRERDEARQDLGRHLHAREHGLVGERVADEDREAQRQVRDVGEGAPGGDGERCQRREDLLLEQLGELGAALLVELANADDTDLVVGQLATQLAFEAVGQAAAEREHALADQRDRLRGRATVLAGILDAGVDLIVQPGDAHHVELVEVRRVDRAELDPLEQRQSRVFGELQHAIVEVQPGELAVYVQRRVIELALLGLVRLGRFGRRALGP